MLLEGKHGLVLGIANKRSIAWGVAQAVGRAGARLAVTYQGERLEENVRELAEGLNDPLILPCDVSKDEDLDALCARVKQEFGAPQGQLVFVGQSVLSVLSVAPGNRSLDSWTDNFHRHSFNPSLPSRGPASCMRE